MSNEYIIDQLQKGWGIVAALYAFDQSSQFSQLIDECKRLSKPVLDTRDQQIYFWAMPIDDNQSIVCGPVAYQPLNNNQLLQVRHRFKFVIKDLLVPVYPLNRILPLICLTTHALTGQCVNIDDLSSIHQHPLGLSETELMDYQKSIYEEESIRMPYEDELQWLSSIEQGINDYTSESQNLYRMQNVGKMVQNNEFKQIEYMAVISITLATRAAIRGGVAPSEAYRISDVYLQKVAVSKDVMEIIKIQNEAHGKFRAMVAQSKIEDSQDFVVERCKDYIAIHLHTDFTIAKMSEELGYHPNYLSRRFSKFVGISIQQYLIKERLIAAANMLKYSEEKVSKISAYLHFSSLSRFGTFFKREYQMTPLEYARKYKSDAFRK